MGFFFKKRYKLSKGLNLNLSNGGLGFSFGVKGLRVSKNSKGETYLNTSNNGIYSRTRLDNNNNDEINEELSSDLLIYVLLIFIILFLAIGEFFCIFVLNLGIIKSLLFTIISLLVLIIMSIIVFIIWEFLKALK